MSNVLGIKDIEGIYRNYVENKFHKVSGLFFSLIIFVLSFVILHQFIKDDFDYEWLCLLLVSLAVFGYWLYFRFYLERNKKNKLGVVVAIYVDESYDKLKLKNNFIRVLRKKIKNEEVSEHINLIVLKNHFCESLDSKKDIDKVNKKIKGNLYIYGDVRCANDGEKKVFINLSGYVTHRPVNLNISKEISNDFNLILPKEISFYEKVDFRGFKVTAEIARLTVRYILGISLYISGFIRLSYNFHSGLDQEIDSFAKPLPINLRTIKKKIPFMLSNECLLLARHHYRERNETESLEWLEKAYGYNANNYGVWLLKAIYNFILDNDPPKALKSIKKAEKCAGGKYFEWMYSKIFLLFWLDKFKEGIKLCKKLSTINYDNEEITVHEVEEFNLKICEQSDEKPIIYFWLGYINFKKKKDFNNAKKYFDIFLSKADESMESITEKTKNYLSEVKQNL
jgi:tetratricopeptide (TPR) repeat protein